MNHSVWLAALLMGWAGSPHCLAMCGPMCATQSGAPRQLAFHAGRLLGYSLAGGLAGASMQAVGAWSVEVQSFRSLWSFVHLLFLILGLLMLVRGDQPLWMLQGAARLWRWISSGVHPTTAHPSSFTWWRSAALGLIWVFWPCGLLYSALTLAALSAGAWEGAVTLFFFALGSGAVLSLMPWLWHRVQSWRLGAHAQRIRNAGIRIAGAMLAGMSGWALWVGLVMDRAPWCVSPN